MADQGIVKIAILKAARYCAVGERSRYQVLQKLEKYGLSNSKAVAVIDQLVKEGFVNETRFANAFVHDKFQFNKWGKKKIEQELRFKHKIDEHIIHEALGRLNEEEYHQMMLTLTEQKAITLKDCRSPTGRNQLTRYLLSKGFEPSLVYDVVGHFVGKKT